MTILKFLVKGFLNIACFGLAVFSFASSAQVTDFADCQSITDRQERFACYDSIEDDTSAAIATAVDESAASVSDSQSSVSNQEPLSEELPVFTVPASQQSEVDEVALEIEEEQNLEVDDFGRDTATQQTAVLEEVGGKTELVTTVAAMRQNRPGMWLITLANGQRWQQTLSKRYFLRIGEEVRIYPTGWGSSFRLTSDRLRGFIQVRRLD